MSTPLYPYDSRESLTNREVRGGFFDGGPERLAESRVWLIGSALNGLRTSVESMLSVPDIYTPEVQVDPTAYQQTVERLRVPVTEAVAEQLTAAANNEPLSVADARARIAELHSPQQMLGPQRNDH